MLNLLWVPATMSFIERSPGKAQNCIPANDSTVYAFAGHFFFCFGIPPHPQTVAIKEPGLLRCIRTTKPWVLGSQEKLPASTVSTWCFLSLWTFSEGLQHMAINIKVSRATAKGLISEPLELISGCPSVVRLCWSFGCTCVRQSWYVKIRCPCPPSLQMKSTWRA